MSCSFVCSPFFNQDYHHATSCKISRLSCLKVTSICEEHKGKIKIRKSYFVSGGFSQVIFQYIAKSAMFFMTLTLVAPLCALPLPIEIPTCFAWNISVIKSCFEGHIGKENGKFVAGESS